MPEIFTNQYALQYERFSATPPRMYEIGARTLSQIDEGIQDHELVVEIGSGTGNSTIILATSNPNLRRLICIEPSEFINLAAHKLDRKKLDLPIDGSIPVVTLSYIEEQTSRVLPVAGKIELVQGRSPELPFRSSSIDRIYCPQSFHWLAFRDEVSPADFGYLGDSISEMARLLRPRGRLLFDSNGHIFNFGEEEINGRKINDLHFTKHPLWQKFDDNFNRYAAQMGFPITQEQRGDRLQQIFNFVLLENLLTEKGLCFIPTNEGKQYLLTLVPVERDNIIGSARDGAKMIKFNRPEMTDLPEDQKDRIIAHVLDITLRENPEIFGEDYYETFVSFVAEKVG